MTRGGPDPGVKTQRLSVHDCGRRCVSNDKEYILDKNDRRITQNSGECKTRKIDTVDWNDRSEAEA